MRKLDVSARDLSAAHKAVATSLLPGVALRTPRRTGALAESWKAGATKTRAKLTSSKPYAGPIEYGWPKHGIEPARMVRDTVDAEQAQIVEQYQHELAKLGAKAGFESHETG